MRLTALILKNFKSIGEEGVRIEFSPITLLFGPNNAGKSTIIQGLYLAHEILCNSNADLDKMYSKSTGLKLGSFKDYVHKHELNRTVTVGIEFSVERGPFGHAKINSAGIEFVIHWDSERSKPLLNQISLAINGKHLTTLYLSYNNYGIAAKIERLSLPIQEVSTCSDSELEDLKRKAEHVWSLKGKQEDYKSELNELCDHIQLEIPILDFYKCYISKYSLAVELLESEELLNGILEKEAPLLFTMYGSYSFASWFKYIDSIIYDNLMPILRKGIPDIYDAYKGLVTDGANGELIETGEIDEAINHFNDLLKTPINCAAYLLENLIYLGPLRAIPERNTSYTKDMDGDEWAEGLAAWKTIAFLPNDQFNLLNNFLNSSNFMKTQYQIVRERILSLDSDSELADGLRGMVEDFENKKYMIGTPGMDMRLYPYLKKFLLEDHTVYIKLLNTENGIVVEPYDMGTGISQLIPCLTAATISHGCQTIAIEQPELHIHPAWQTALADVFIYAIAKDETKPLFILETHSEHLLLRMLRRIRNTNQNESVKQFMLTPDDLAVYWVGRNEDSTEIYPLIVDSTGSFTTPWPEGFFEERDEELFG